MANRRSRIADFYSKPSGLRQLEERAAAAASSGQYSFKGNSLAFAVVTRTDLNGYSEWARERPIGDRAAVLDNFFSRVIPLLGDWGGVYFRDEGDCIIGIFSNYFNSGASFAAAEAFCMSVSSETYGSPQLSAKSTISCGQVAIYQKAHELGSDDWSAEGEPFVRAARIEQASASKQQVTYLAEDYDTHFSGTNFSSTGNGRWVVNYDKLQIPGLGAAGGWMDVVVLSYRA